MISLTFSSGPWGPKCLKYQNVPNLGSFRAIGKPWERFQSWDIRIYFIPVPKDHTVAFRICKVWKGNNWRFGRENRFCAKKTPLKRLFLCARFGVTWLWKDLEAKRLTPVQLLGWPWKLWGITLRTSCVEGRWHQNWAHTSPLHCFSVCEQKFANKWFFG